MSLKETTKAVIPGGVVKGEMTAAEGAARLKLSKRHVFRLKAKIRERSADKIQEKRRSPFFFLMKSERREYSRCIRRRPPPPDRVPPA